MKGKITSNSNLTFWNKTDEEWKMSWNKRIIETKETKQQKNMLVYVGTQRKEWSNCTGRIPHYFLLVTTNKHAKAMLILIDY